MKGLRSLPPFKVYYNIVKRGLCAVTLAERKYYCRAKSQIVSIIEIAMNREECCNNGKVKEYHCECELECRRLKNTCFYTKAQELVLAGQRLSI